jgi:CRISPR system Cascade subunit CasE
MYLSRIRLNESRRDTMRALSSPHILHGAIEQAFCGERQRNLWRVDHLNGNCYLLILSTQQPDLTHIAKQFGCPSDDPLWETKDYSKLLDRLETGQNWHFRLCANPVRSSFAIGKRGEVHAHVTTKQQKQWLQTRACKNGFDVYEDSFDVIETNWKIFFKNPGTKVTIRTAVFEGILMITDVEKLKHALVCGIGRAKAYGCGLLTLAQM